MQHFWLTVAMLMTKKFMLIILSHNHNVRLILGRKRYREIQLVFLLLNVKFWCEWGKRSSSRMEIPLGRWGKEQLCIY